MKKQITVSQAELARELDASRSTIGRLVARGMPGLADGQLDRLQALRWLANYRSGHGGGWTAGMRGKDGLQVRAQALLAGKLKAAAVATEPAAPEGTTLRQISDLCKKAYADGQANTAESLCRSIRETLVPVIRDADLPGIVAEDGGFRLRVGLIALIDYLVVGWCEELVTPGRLPAIDFKKHFGSVAKPAKVWFEALQAYWQANPEDETAPMWPAAFAAEWPLDGPVPMPEVQPGKTKAPSQRRRAAKRSTRT